MVRLSRTLWTLSQVFFNGPLLFNIIVNDLLALFPNSFAYADDTVIYSIAQAKTLSLLPANSPFKKVQVWYTSNCFTINVSKTCACIFSNRKLSDFPTPPSPCITLDKTKIKADWYICKYTRYQSQLPLNISHSLLRQGLITVLHVFCSARKIPDALWVSLDYQFAIGLPR